METSSAPQLLSNFIRSVTSWPRTDAERKTVTERIREILDVPIVGMVLVQGQNPDQASKPVVAVGQGIERILDSTAKDPAILAGRIHELVRTQNGVLSSLGGLQVRTIQGPSAPVLKDSGGASSARLETYSILRLVAELRAEPGARKERVKQEMGYLIVGTQKPISASSELMLIAIAQKLTALATESELENAIAVRDQFLSIASHELKTPLTSIYGILQLQERMLRIKRDESVPALQEKQQSFLKTAIRQVERLNELIDSLLNVSRIQNGRFMVEPSDADVSTLVQETVSARLKVIAQEAGVRLDLDVQPSVSAWVDSIRFEEVVTNLVMNAIRFSPEGGTVWIQLSESDGQITLKVKDQGPTLSMDDRARVFLPFERAHRSSRLGGLGLGLFISRQIARLHGGDVIVLESLPGKGNVFEARFPTQRRAEQAS